MMSDSESRGDQESSNTIPTDNGPHKRSRGYSELPDNARFLICRYVMADTNPHPPFSSRPTITLSPPSFSRDVWHPKIFTPIITALAPILPLLSVSRDLRADFLIAFLSSHTFHAVFSPYVNTRLSPFATTWLFRYGCYMRSVILELDMTKLGHGPELQAVNLLPGTRHIEKLVKAVAESQRSRGEDRPLQEFTLLCRRFYGVRELEFKTLEDLVLPQTPSYLNAQKGQERNSNKSPDESTMSSSPDSSVLPTIPAARRRPSASSSTSSQDTSMSTVKPSGESASSSLVDGDEDEAADDSSKRAARVEYCPEYHFSICSPLLDVLRGRVSSLRVCGFGDQCTQLFVSALFPPDSQYAYHLAPSSGPWGRLADQKRYVDIGQGNVIFDSELLDTDTATPWLCFQGPVMPPPPIVNPDKTLSLPENMGWEDKLAFADVVKMAMAATTSRASSRMGGSSADGKEKEKKKLFLKLMEKCLLSREKNRRVISRDTTASV